MATREDKKSLRARILQAFLGGFQKNGVSASKEGPSLAARMGFSALKGLGAAQQVSSPEAGLAAGIAAGLFGPTELRSMMAKVSEAKTSQKPRIFAKVDEQGNLQIVTVDPNTGESVSQPLGGAKFPRLPSDIPVFTEKEAAKRGTIPFRTKIVPDPERRGTQESVSSVLAAQKALEMVDPIFDKFSEMSEPKARFAALKKGPIGTRILSSISRASFPELKALEDNFIANTVFSMGGKQLTITEKETITDAFLPHVFDDAKSREIKRRVVKEYLSGKIEIIAAARLLGPAGKKALEFLESRFDPSAPGIGEREKFIRILVKDKGFSLRQAEEAADNEGLE